MGDHIPYRTKLVVANAGLYCIEVRIPGDLVDLVGKVVFVRSMATKEEEEANRLLPEYHRTIVDALEAVRHQRELSSDPDADADDPRTPLGDAIRHVHLLFPETRFRMDEPQVRLLMSAADRLILDFAMPIKPYSRDYWRLCQRIRKLQIEAPVANPPENDAAASNANVASDCADITFGRLIDAFEAEVGADWRFHNRENWRNALQVACQFFGADRRVASLKRKDFIALRGLLEDLAPMYWARKDMRGLSIVEAAQKCRELDLPRRALTTINTILRMYRALMEWALREELVEKNPALGLQRRERHEFVKRVMPFNTEQLNTIFSSGPRYATNMPLEKRDGFFWLPLISMWTGMRLSECARLHVSEICFVEDIPIIRITSIRGDDLTTTKFTKSPNAERRIPIHPELERLGFLDYWRWRQGRGDTVFFPEYLRPNGGFRFDRVSFAFVQYLEKIGVKTSEVSFRSFRHGFRDALRDADISRERTRMLGGWRPVSIADRYGAGGSVRNLYKDMRRVHYPGVDLSHLWLNLPPPVTSTVSLPALRVYPA